MRSKAGVSSNLRRLWIAWGVLGTIFLLGCAKPERDFTADVFIRTKGGENIKCGLVTILVFEANAVKSRELVIQASLSNRALNLQTRLVAANARMKIATTEWNAALEAEKNAKTRLFRAEVEESSAQRTYESDKGLLDYHDLALADLRKRKIATDPQIADEERSVKAATAEKDKSMRAWKQAGDALIAARHEIESAMKAADKLEKMHSAQSEWIEQMDCFNKWPQTACGTIFGGLPLPVATAKTDADGKCVGKVPKPGKYAVAAQFSRLVGVKSEDTRWLIWVDFNDQKPQKIMLSNDNTCLSESPDNVFQVIPTPKLPPD